MFISDYKMITKYIHTVFDLCRRFSNFNASKELPFDLEDALTLWLNKVNHANTKRYQNTKPGMSTLPQPGTKFVREKPACINFPFIEDLVECFPDGKSVLSALLFYCPDVIGIDGMF